MKVAMRRHPLWKRILNFPFSVLDNLAEAYLEMRGKR
jgi:hypothetical protein